MSFWEGLVKGIEANDAERKDEADRAERKEARAEDVAWREKMFEATEARHNAAELRDAQRYETEREDKRLQDERHERHFQLNYGLQKDQYESQEAQRTYQNSLDLAKSFPELFSSLYGGGSTGGGSTGGGGGGGGINSDKVPSPEEIAKQVKLFKFELGGEDGIETLTEPNRQIVDAVLANPTSAVGIMALAQAQKLKGNNFDLSKISEYINYAGVMEEKGSREERDAFILKFQESQKLGTPLEAKEILEGVAALSAYKPAQVIWNLKKVDKPTTIDASDVKHIQDQVNREMLSSLKVKKYHLTQEIGKLKAGTDEHTKLSAERAKLVEIETRYDTSATRDTAVLEMLPLFGRDVLNKLADLPDIYDSNTMDILYPPELLQEGTEEQEVTVPTFSFEVNDNNQNVITFDGGEPTQEQINEAIAANPKVDVINTGTLLITRNRPTPELNESTTISDRVEVAVAKIAAKADEESVAEGKRILESLAAEFGEEAVEEAYKNLVEGRQ